MKQPFLKSITFTILTFLFVLNSCKKDIKPATTAETGKFLKEKLTEKRTDAEIINDAKKIFYTESNKQFNLIVNETGAANTNVQALNKDPNFDRANIEDMEVGKVVITPVNI